MSTLTWPANLPAMPLWAGYGLDPQSVLKRTQMETGLARQRRVFVNPPTTVNVRWVMNGLQLQLFKAWMGASTAGAFFDMSLRLDEATREVEARFLGKTRIAVAGIASWFVEATLEVRDTPQLSSDVVEAILTYGSAELIAAGALIKDANLIPAIEEWAFDFPAP